ncbi:MAG: hypothetical protein O2895_00150 [Chloroflexi bacterium]|nr:hypothetical protein [Chloroflexota bacterium]
MRLEVTTEPEAQVALDAFNGFHDGFVRRLTLASHDASEARGVHASGRAPDIELLFAHHNYAGDTRPVDQLVRATFAEVTELQIGISGSSYENAIKWLAIGAATRGRDGGREAGPAEPCLRATLVLAQLTEQREWEDREAVRFGFARATFEEVEPT